jgi:integrase
VFGLKTSPAAGLKPGKIIGDKRTGDRVLNDSELFALWRAAGRMRNPVGAVYRTLMLTGLRLNEVADAVWGEFDLSAKIWLIPKTRMKGRNTKARSHAVPLTADLLTILKALPRFENGDFMFSTTFGASPIWVGSKIKDQLDARMLRTLRALARRRGDNPKKVTLPDWCNHDIRRTFRTNLSRLRIAEEAREACLAHVRPGIKQPYDWHDYLPEKREALELWAARLRSIVAPPPASDNVIRMPATS